MPAFFNDILINTETSCSKNAAASILLGRRSIDPIYKDSNPDRDPFEVHENFMEWLNVSIFDDLMEERDGLFNRLIDARDEGNKDSIALVEDLIVRCDDTIRLAVKILRDIDDELAKGADSKLRLIANKSNPEAPSQITLSSLLLWSKSLDYLPATTPTSIRETAPPVQSGSAAEDPLINSKGGMSPTSTRSFLATFAVLFEAYMDQAGNKYRDESGSDVNEAGIAKLIKKLSLPGGRQERFLKGQSVSSIEERLKEVIKVSTDALNEDRAKALKPPTK